MAGGAGLGRSVGNRARARCSACMARRGDGGGGAGGAAGLSGVRQLEYADRRAALPVASLGTGMVLCTRSGGIVSPAHAEPRPRADLIDAGSNSRLCETPLDFRLLLRRP